MINVVCAVIEDEGGRVLACQRPEGKPLAGKWEFPGGKVEAGERAEEALLREIKEELACDIEVGVSLPDVEHQYPEFAIRLQPFICRLLKETPQSLEHDAMRWVSLGECVALDWAEADIPVWKHLTEVRQGGQEQRRLS